MRYNFNLEQTQTNMIPRQQIKSLSMANDPITTGLSQEADMQLDNKYINDICTYWHVFLDRIWSRRKLVQRLGNIGQEKSMEVEQNHIVISGGHGGQEGDSCHIYMAMSWRREAREARRRKSFLSYLFLIKSHQFVFLI